MKKKYIRPAATTIDFESESVMQVLSAGRIDNEDPYKIEKLGDDEEWDARGKSWGSDSDFWE